MIRGTTPTLFFYNFPFELSGIKQLNIIFAQTLEHNDDYVLFVKEKDDCEILDNNILTVKLKEKETLKLRDNKLSNAIVQIQIKIEFEAGDIVASNVIKTKVDRILQDGWEFDG